jgi:hypothetical protein
MAKYLTEDPVLLLSPYKIAAPAPPDPELLTSMPMRELRVMAVDARRVEAIMWFRRV